MSRKEEIRADLTAAIKAHDEDRKATLRMLLAAITLEETSGQAHEADDEAVQNILFREAKKRAEAAEVFAQNGREELAEKERREGAIIAEYLPQPLSDAELDEVVAKVVAEVQGDQPVSPKLLGPSIKKVKELVEGRADGARISAAVKAKLL